MRVQPRLLATAAVSVAALPVALSAFLWRGRLLRRRFIELDPFEIDLQLTERNDDA